MLESQIPSDIQRSDFSSGYQKKNNSQMILRPEDKTHWVELSMYQKDNQMPSDTLCQISSGTSPSYT